MVKLIYQKTKRCRSVKKTQQKTKTNKKRIRKKAKRNNRSAIWKSDCTTANRFLEGSNIRIRTDTQFWFKLKKFTLQIRKRFFP